MDFLSEFVRNGFRTLVSGLKVLANGVVGIGVQGSGKVSGFHNVDGLYFEPSDEREAREMTLIGVGLLLEGARVAVRGAPQPVAARAPVSGETPSTISGKAVHKMLAEERRASGDWDVVNRPITDLQGKPILVEKRVNTRTGEPLPESGLQAARPDAASFNRRLIVDDKPLGRDIMKDRQEVIRFIRAYEQREGTLPETIAIQRYDPATGKPVRTDLYSPADFLPGDGG